MRVFCWLVTVAVFAGPYVEGAISEPASDLPGPPLPRVRQLPEIILTPALIAIPLALLGSWLAFRKPEGRLRQFRRPTARTADLSLVAFALFAVGTHLNYNLSLIGVHITADWGWLLRRATPLIIAFWALRALGRRELENSWGLGLGERPRRELLIGLLALAWLLPLHALFVHARLQALDPNLYRVSLVWRCASVILIGPVIEEVFFRGVLYTSLRGSQSWPGAAGVTAFLFAIAHGFNSSIWITVNHFAFGFVLCLVREWRGSLVGCVLAHSLSNLVLTVPWVVSAWNLFR